MKLTHDGSLQQRTRSHSRYRVCIANRYTLWSSLYGFRLRTAVPAAVSSAHTRCCGCTRRLFLAAANDLIIKKWLCARGHYSSAKRAYDGEAEKRPDWLTMGENRRWRFLMGSGPIGGMSRPPKRGRLPGDKHFGTAISFRDSFRANSLAAFGVGLSLKDCVTRLCHT